MRFQAHNTSANLRQRRAFSLVELLVVIAIIAVLASLITAAAMRMIRSQHIKNTEFMMTQIDGALQKHWSAVALAAQTENMDAVAGAAAMNTIRIMAGNDERRTRVLYVKFRLKQEFPISYAEALAPSPLLPKRSYVEYLKNGGVSTAASSKEESAACLYMTLSQAPSGTNFDGSQLASAVKEFSTPNGKIKAFVDDWANPYIFCRWPTEDLVLDAMTPLHNTKLRDLQDPDGQLLSTNWPAPKRSQFENPAIGHSLTQGGKPHAYYLIPVIMSAGNDFKPGVDPATLKITNAGDQYDNIYSYNLNKNSTHNETNK